MSALLKIKNAGFDVALEAGNLVITPFSRLSEQQLKYLKEHKAEIIQELKMANNDYPVEIVVYNRMGDSFLVTAETPERAAFLLAANPKPTAAAIEALKKELENCHD